MRTTQIAFLTLTLAVALAACNPPPAAMPDGGGDNCPTATETVPEPKRHTPRWAFEPWISKDISNTQDTYDFVAGFVQRNIPVGAVVLDSPWETSYNTFVPNPSRYPQFEKLSTDLHAMNIRLILWITQMVNSTSLDLETGGDKYVGASPNFDQAMQCRFLINEGQQYVWWKGTGAGVDFMNPRATAWWHRQQDAILPLIDGWKLDFGDSYVLGDTVDTAAGTIPHQQYSEAYYRDFLAYGVQKRGPDFTTMVRGWDASYAFQGRFFARPEHAPVVWAGDNRRDSVGLADALDTMFRSAKAGYVMVGSDLGGYLDLDDKTYAPVAADWDIFSRWMAISALTPFMQLHGRANLTPWTIPDNPDEMVKLYRYHATLHHELVPFFYSLAEEAYAGGGMSQSILRPLGDPATWAGDYRFFVGDALFVAPIIGPAGSPNPTTRDITFPGSGSYYDWWDEGTGTIQGGITVRAYASAAARGRVPLFVREGAIVPLAVAEDTTDFGTAASKGQLTILVFPGADPSTFVLHEEDGMNTTIGAKRVGSESTITLSRAPRPVILRVRTTLLLKTVLADGQRVGGAPDRQSTIDGPVAAFFDEPAFHRAFVKVPAGTKTVVLRE